MQPPAESLFHASQRSFRHDRFPAASKVFGKQVASSVCFADIIDRL